MKILAIESTGLPASVAVVDEGHVIGEYTLHDKKNHSQTLMPMIESLLKILEMDLCEMDLIGCSSGPGSFTGLRIGAATAKALAYATGIPLVPVPTLDAMAYNVFNPDSVIVPIMDARRSQVYTAFYEWHGADLIRLTEYCAEDIHEIARRAADYDRRVIFLGDGVPIYKEEIQEIRAFDFAPPPVNWQRAGSVGSLGLRLEPVPCESFTPFYLRRSQAERERL